jgi:hypothetical protein
MNSELEKSQQHMATTEEKIRDFAVKVRETIVRIRNYEEVSKTDQTLALIQYHRRNLGERVEEGETLPLPDSSTTADSMLSASASASQRVVGAFHVLHVNIAYFSKSLAEEER